MTLHVFNLPQKLVYKLHYKLNGKSHPKISSMTSEKIKIGKKCQVDDGHNDYAEKCWITWKFQGFLARCTIKTHNRKHFSVSSRILHHFYRPTLTSLIFFCHSLTGISSFNTVLTFSFEFWVKNRHLFIPGPSCLWKCSKPRNQAAN